MKFYSALTSVGGELSAAPITVGLGIGAQAKTANADGLGSDARRNLLAFFKFCTFREVERKIHSEAFIWHGTVPTVLII